MPTEMSECPTTIFHVEMHFQIRLRLLGCKSNSKYKMNAGENELWVFGSTMENSPENDFRCLVTF